MPKKYVWGGARGSALLNWPNTALSLIVSYFQGPFSPHPTVPIEPRSIAYLCRPSANPSKSRRKIVEKQTRTNRKVPATKTQFKPPSFFICPAIFSLLFGHWSWQQSVTPLLCSFGIVRVETPSFWPPNGTHHKWTNIAHQYKLLTAQSHKRQNLTTSLQVLFEINKTDANLITFSSPIGRL